jgi:hypothetical protein
MRNTSYLLLLPAALGLLLAPEIATSQAFSYQFIRNDMLPMTLGDASWGDLNRDGRMDLVMTGLAGHGNKSPLGTTFINEGIVGSVDGRGDSVWTLNTLPQGQGVRAAWMSSTAWVDINHDGVLEFILSGASATERPYNPTSRIYRLTGSEFTEMPTDIAGVFGGSLDWGDYDNDGDSDLLLTGETDDGYLTRLYALEANLGSVDLVDSGIRLIDMSLGEGKFGDYDSDGDLDILLAGDTGSGFRTVLYRNDAGTFSEVATPFASLVFSSVDWGDYDNDGDLDILLAGGFLSPLIVEGHSTVYRNDGGDMFTDIHPEIDGAFHGAAHWGDYDNDGLLDIMLSGGTTVRDLRIGRLYRNEGGDQFRFALNISGLLYSSAAFGDYDYDGDLDLAQIGEGVTVIFRNDQLRVNEPPTVPDGLGSVAANGGASLSWNPSTDVQTDSPGLSYNIRMGSSPGAIDIVAPMSDVQTGRRLVSAMGNVQNNTSWTILDLQPGTYFWSVQAIDNAYNASSWSEEATFIVSAAGLVATGTEGNEYPHHFELSGGFPNPFATQTVIEYSLTEGQFVEAQIYTTLGEKVVTLQSEYAEGGRHRLTWDGTDWAGGQVSAGVYLLRLDASEGSKTIRLVRVKS